VHDWLGIISARKKNRGELHRLAENKREAAPCLKREFSETHSYRVQADEKSSPREYIKISELQGKAKSGGKQGYYSFRG